MKRETTTKVTITVRLTAQQHALLRRLCRLKGMTQTAYLASVATEQATQQLKAYAAREYAEGRASLSELATRTALDVPTLMEAVSLGGGAERTAVEAFLTAAKTLADTHADPGFYELAVKAVTRAA